MHNFFFNAIYKNVKDFKFKNKSLQCLLQLTTRDQEETLDLLLSGSAQCHLQKKLNNNLRNLFLNVKTTHTHRYKHIKVLQHVVMTCAGEMGGGWYQL